MNLRTVRYVLNGFKEMGSANLPSIARPDSFDS